MTTPPDPPEATPVEPEPPPVAPPPRSRDYRGLFADEFAPLPVAAGPLSILDDLLKRPARVLHSLLLPQRAGRILLTLLSTLGVSALAYGLIVGSFSAGQQLLAAPLKVFTGMLLSALICLPSLYVFTSLSGGRQSLRDVAAILLVSLSLTGILLIGFAPIAWLFSQATHAISFMGALHLAFWLIAVGFGLRLMRTAFLHINRGGGGALRLWGAIFILVTLQMTTTLRPFIAEPTDGWMEGKKFFLSHWNYCLSHQPRVPHGTR